MPQTILIVEDEPAISQILGGEFERKGFRVLRANNGSDGLNLAVVEKPDAMVLDIIMPGLNGFEVCKQVRAKPELSDIVIVMTSARSYKPDIEKALEIGADDYVIKPGEIGEVVEVVMKHLTKRSQHP
jgi:two-component system phosphate regulon response regulator PhoB